jgi:hypothetical protein
MLKGKIEML